MTNLSQYLSKLDEDTLLLWEQVQQLVLSNFEELEVKLKYGVPFFCLRGGNKYVNIAFFNITPKKVVYIGFMYGNLIWDEARILSNDGETKLVRKYYLSVYPLPNFHFIDFFEQSIMIAQDSIKKNRR